MKSILLVGFFVFSLQAQAWTVESKVNIGSKGEFQDTVTLYCRPEEKLCQEVCQNTNLCWKEQELCFNCLGTSNPILRVVFTEMDRLYRNSSKVVSGKDLSQVFRKDHIFVAARSIYNFYSSIDNADVLLRFQSLCPAGAGEPLVVLAKDQNQVPKEIKYIICDGLGPNNQDMYVLEYAPQVQNGNVILNNKP